jgi:hypothetical protein
MHKKYIYLGIISIILAGVVVMSISNMIDDKINNIVINVPEINIPEIKIDHRGCDCRIAKPNKYYTAYTEEPSNHIEYIDPSKEYFETINSSQVKSAAPKYDAKMRLLRGKKKETKYDKITNNADLDYTDDVEGSKQYAVMGCSDRRKKLKLYPDLVACAQPNYMTAENYYNQNFEYPYIPGQNEEYWLGADYKYTSFLANADKSYRIISRSRKKTSKSPFPANYWFQN